ncbi:unnamed protein product, partial [Prorocentrum cordatum]
WRRRRRGGAARACRGAPAGPGREPAGPAAELDGPLEGAARGAGARGALRAHPDLPAPADHCGRRGGLRVPLHRGHR